MNVIATNDMDEIYEDPEYGEMGELEKLSTKVDESEDTDDTAASVEAAVKQKEEIVAMEAAAVNGGDRDGVNTFAAAIVVEVEAVNAKCVGVEAVKGDIMVKGSKVKATAKGRVLTKEEHVEGYETREVLSVEMPRSSERIKKISQGLDVKALNFKTRKQRLKVQELQGSPPSPPVSALPPVPSPRFPRSPRSPPSASSGRARSQNGLKSPSAFPPASPHPAFPASPRRPPRSGVLCAFPSASACAATAVSAPPSPSAYLSVPPRAFPRRLESPLRQSLRKARGPSDKVV
ncbi:unnamed protein product [Closterium sp. Naga37s-1]|nr:unnamed protein product [Closterium sp. Naga37s-1]